MPGEQRVIEIVKNLFLIVSALIPIVDPLGRSPIFLALTSAYGPSARGLGAASPDNEARYRLQ
jgi:small neutral amino acid transporter SnatA (MarC family)